MKTQFKWINVFLIVFSASVLAILLSIFVLRHQLYFDEGVITLLRLGALLILMLALISSVVSALLYYGLRANQRRLVQKLQWLILGNYTHDVFQKKANQPLATLDYLGIVDDQLNSLSIQLKESADNLLAFSEKHTPLALEQEEQILLEERKRLARDLHDSVSQQLYAASMMVSGAKYTLRHDEAIMQQMTILEKTIDAAQQELRALLLHLRPVDLENKTLSQGLLKLMVELSQKVSIEVVYDIDDCELLPTVESHLFRIVQELVSNSLRHAKATRLEVYLKKDNARVKLRVVDNGQGFDVRKDMIGHYGLQNVKDRVSGIGGQVTIVSVPYHGTSVDITI